MTRRELFRISGTVLTARTGARAADAGYEEIRRALAGRKLLVVPYSHMDWAWVHTVQWQADRAALVLSQVLDILETTPEYRFFVDTWNEFFERFLHRAPGRLPQFRKAVSKGQIAICGGTIANQHLAWMGSESLIRNMTLGRRLFQQWVPEARLDIMVHNDVMPGPAQMPQILSKAGYRAFRMCRPDQAFDKEGVPRNFIWEGLDGSTILVSRGDYGGFFYKKTLDGFEKNWPAAVGAFYQQEVRPCLEPRGGSPVWLPMGADDSLPLHTPLLPLGQAEEPIPLFAFLKEWARREQTPLRLATPVEYFDELAKESSSLPRHRGVLEPTMWTFWYGLNGNKGLRRWRARAEQALLEAEAFQNCALPPGAPYPQEEFESLWRELLNTFSHAQMWLYKEDYRRQSERVERVVLNAEERRDQCLQGIAGRVQLKNRDRSVVIFNSLPWERTEVVEFWAHFQDAATTNFTIRDARGETVPFQVLDVNWTQQGAPKPTSFKEALILAKVRVPALGYIALHFEPAAGALDLGNTAPAGRVLDTETLLVEFSERGCESVVDKATGVRFPQPGMLRYHEIRDVGPYHFGPVINTFGLTNTRLTKMAPGPLRSSLTLRGNIGPHEVEVTAHVYPHARRVAFAAQIDSRGGSGHFMATTAVPADSKLSAGVHFGVEPRDLGRVHYGDLERLNRNVFYGEQWVDASNGKAGVTFVGTTGEKGYQYFPEQNVLGHFLLMTIPPAEANNWERFVTDARLGDGRHSFEYQFLFHEGDWKAANAPRRALEALHPLLPVSQNEVDASPSLPEERSFVSVSPAAVQMSACYREGKRWMVRLFEGSGEQAEATLRLPFRVAAAQEVDFHGGPRRRQMAVNGSELRLQIKPWEIVTLALSGG